MKLKLIHKLLIAMFACAALVLVLITLVTRVSIGSGFMDFLQQQERNQVELVVPALVNWYSKHGQWDELTDNPREFYGLVFTALFQGSESQSGTGPRWLEGQPRGGRGPGLQGSGPGGRGPGPLGRNGLPQRIFLLDAGRSPLVGNAPPEVDAGELLPVTVDGANVGWVGVIAIRGFQLPEEEAFISQLRNNLLIGLGLGLAVAALLAWLLARHLSRPVNEVAAGIRALASGDFKRQMDISGSDEIARLGDDVNRLSAALREHETARKRWISDMAHELRTPLAIIKGELEAMSDGIRPLDKDNLASVGEEVKHLTSLVDDLHKLTMTDAGALAYKMQAVEFNGLVQLAVDAFRGRAESKDLQLNYSDAEQNIKLLGDEQRLRQLLNNLLDNAVRYTDSGGRIAIALSKSDNKARLSISDTAPGASEQECERLFERLYRMENSRNRNLGGSGLGLAICRNIVEAHDGEISAEPGPDGGLLITVTMPLDQ